MSLKQRILVVDDSRSIRRMIEQSLVSAGFDVVATSSGDEALDSLKNQTVDVIVTDLNMPGIDGLQLSRRLREYPRTQSCPILILTTETSFERKQEARSAGANGWVLKPFQGATLVRAIRQVCSRAGVQS